MRVLYLLSSDLLLSISGFAFFLVFHINLLISSLVSMSYWQGSDPNFFVCIGNRESKTFTLEKVNK